MVIDTLLVCFCEDSERNDGSFEKPYFMSKNLLDVCSQIVAHITLMYVLAGDWRQEQCVVVDLCVPM